MVEEAERALARARVDVADSLGVHRALLPLVGTEGSAIAVAVGLALGHAPPPTPEAAQRGEDMFTSLCRMRGLSVVQAAALRWRCRPRSWRRTPGSLTRGTAC